MVFEKHVVTEEPKNRIVIFFFQICDGKGGVFQKMCFRNSNLLIYDEKMIYRFGAETFKFYFWLFFRLFP